MTARHAPVQHGYGQLEVHPASNGKVLQGT